MLAHTQQVYQNSLWCFVTSQCWSQAVVCVCTPRMYPKSGYLLPGDLIFTFSRHPFYKWHYSRLVDGVVSNREIPFENNYITFPLLRLIFTDAVPFWKVWGPPFLGPFSQKNFGARSTSYIDFAKKGGVALLAGWVTTSLPIDHDQMY